MPISEASCDPKVQAEVARLQDMMAQCDKMVAGQRGCFLHPQLVSCNVSSVLAGARVKVKCRDSISTVLKSEVYQVPAGGGELDLVEPTGHVLYEGDNVLNFELCQSCHLRSSKVLATGSLSVADVFESVGLQSETGCWAVPLQARDGQTLGSLEVSIRCWIYLLGPRGSTALRAYTVPARPKVNVAAVDNILGHLTVNKARKYCTRCNKATENLQAALAAAEACAKAREVGVVIAMAI